ncbi:MAG: hypothetical protein JWM93_2675 [Frankiales bacterium]|nr:hypothetical protein [Frankiales bacterium]
MAKLMYEALRELRDARGLSRGELSRMTVRLGFPGVPEKSIDALESEKRAGQLPKASTIRALAQALEVEPEYFYEWPIALAQEARATRSPAEIARGAAQRREGKPRSSRPGQTGKPGKGRAA